MTNSETVLLVIADQYEAAIRQHGGKSLTRVATIVASRGSFFEPLRAGKTCTVRNLDAFHAYFADQANWPHHTIPYAAQDALAMLGCVPAKAA
jgi:hypothetical protein